MSDILIPDRLEREMLYHPIKGLDVATAVEHWIDTGRLNRVVMSEEMLPRYLEIASLPPPHHLDDGEAVRIAVAEAMRATVLIDERRGRRVVTERFSGLQLQSSAGLFRLIAEQGTMEPERLAEALFFALYRSRMRVAPDGLISWVVSTIGKERAVQCMSYSPQALGSKLPTGAVFLASHGLPQP